MRASPLTPSSLPDQSAAFITLKKRKDFLRLRKSRKRVVSTLILLAKRQPEHRPLQSDELAEKLTDCPARIGLTVTKKIGNAVVRNKVRRRFRAAMRQVAAEHVRSNYDYVLIARHTTANAPFTRLIADLEKAFSQMHQRQN